LNMKVIDGLLHDATVELFPSECFMVELACCQSFLMFLQVAWPIHTGSAVSHILILGIIRTLSRRTNTGGDARVGCLI
jgi:hypothetical protein